MTLKYVKCKPKNKDVSFIECATCKGCKAHGAEFDEFPLLMRKKCLTPHFRHSENKVVSVTRITGCLRKQFFNITKDWSMLPKGFIAMSVGTALHEYLMPLWAINEQRLVWTTPKGNKLIGYFDCININNRTLYDLKTTGWGKYKQDGVSKMDVEQILIYANILKHKYDFDLEAIKISYLGGGDKECEEYNVPYKDMIKEINKKVDDMYKAIETNVVPKGNPVESWECEYCEWSEDCKFKIKK